MGLEKFAERVFYFYRKWSPALVTMEFVGAQSWFRDYARVLERDKYRHPVSLPRLGRLGKPALPLPRLTSRLEAAEKTNEGKEAYIVAQLQSWLHSGRLHLHKDQEHLLGQIARFPDASGLKDLLDCLAQGPSVWRAPVAYHPLNEMRGRKRLLDLVEQPDAVTGYRRPWG